MNEPIDSYLDALFEQARLEPLPISTSEIGSNLPLPKPIAARKFWYVKGIILISIIASLLVWFFYISKTKTILPINSTNASSPIPKITNQLEKVLEPEKGVQINPTVNKQFISPPLIKKHTFSIHPEPSQYAASYLPSSPEEGKTVLELTYEELAKLHIYTDGCELKYTNLKDSAYTQRPALKQSTVKHFYFTEIHPAGGGYTLNNRAFGNDSILKLYADSFLSSYPMMIEKIVTNVQSKFEYDKVGDIKTDFLEPKISMMFSEQYKELAKELLVPVKIILTAKPNIYGKTDQDVVFWFKPNEAFINVLPSEKAALVKANYSNFSETEYQTKIAVLCKQKSEKERELVINQNQLDSIISHALVLNNKQLRSLGFSGSNSYHAVNGKLSVRIKVNKDYGVPNYYFRHARTNFSTFNVFYVDPIPLFLFDGKNTIDVIDKNQYNLERIHGADNQYILRKYFIDELPNLVPVKIQFKAKNGKIFTEYFWYRNTLQFQNKISQ